MPEKGKVQEKKGKAEEKLPFLTVGKRKRAVARARFRKGSGVVSINGMPMERALERLNMLRVMEVIELAGDVIKRCNVDVHASGGGCVSQAEACRIAIAKGLAEVGGEPVRKAYLAHDRSMLIYDPRRTEPHKPPRSSKGARRHKQRSKR